MSPQPQSRTYGLPQALDAIGDRWSIMTLRAVYEGAHTFSELRVAIGISDGVLATRLARLTDHGMLKRVKYHDRPERWRYVRSDSTVALWQPGIALWLWDQRWERNAASTIRLIHTVCGKSVVPVFGCGACDTVGVTTHCVRTAYADGLPAELNMSSGTRAVRLAARPSVDAITLLGDHWSTALLAVTLFGARTFSEIRAGLGKISSATLSERLRLFVAHGLLEPVSGDGQRRKLYRLTEKSRDFFPVFAAVNEWSLRFAEESGLQFTHVSCGAPLRPQFTCNVCHGPMRESTTRFEMSGGAPLVVAQP